jgi:hypothetical protein
VSIILRAQVLELPHGSFESGFNVGDGCFGKVGAVMLKATVVLDEFFSVKLGERVLRADRPRSTDEAWHADPRVELCATNPV